MRCCIQRLESEGRDALYLAYWRSELLDDIDKRAWVQGDAWETETEHEKHQLIDITQQDNIDIVTRAMDTAVASVKELFNRLTRRPVDNGVTEYDNKLENADYEIWMRVDRKWFSRTTAEAIGPIVHDYIVSYAIYRWCLLCAQPFAESWAVVCDELWEKLKKLALHRTGRARITPCPF